MTLQEAGLNLTEEQYRELPQLSYSMISRFDREGYECIEHLDEKISTPSLLYGSMVDCLLTQGSGALNEKYACLDVAIPTGAMATIAQYLLEQCTEKQLALVSDIDLITAANVAEYYTKWKDETRINKIRESLTEYYNACKTNEGKIIVDVKDMEDAKQAAHILQTDPLTMDYFVDSGLPFVTDERIFQLQLSATVPTFGIQVKGMLDLVVLDHQHQVIYPCDLKTTKSIYTFEDSFYYYRYYLQAALYTFLLEETIRTKCPELQSYSIAPYKFIVIDRNAFKPIVFEWNTSADVVDKYGNKRASVGELLVQLDWILHHQETKLPKDWFESIQLNRSVKIKNYAEQ